MEIKDTNTIICQKHSEPDLRPEYHQYHDEGCKVSKSCLECSLTQCVYDRPNGKRGMLKAARNRTLVGLFHAGNSAETLMKVFGVSRRTVQRVIQKAKRYQNSTGHAMVMIAWVVVIPALQFMSQFISFVPDDV